MDIYTAPVQGQTAAEPPPVPSLAVTGQTYYQNSIAASYHAEGGVTFVVLEILDAAGVAISNGDASVPDAATGNGIATKTALLPATAYRWRLRGSDYDVNNP
jgi:hypothetical protein